MTNARGGIKGRPIKFVIQDTATNPAVAVQFTNALLAKKAPLVLGPGFTSECFAVAPLIKNQLIDYCISPAVLPPAGSTIYSAGLDARDYPVLLLRYFVAKHWTRVALISFNRCIGPSLRYILRSSRGTQRVQKHPTRVARALRPRRPQRQRAALAHKSRIAACRDRMDRGHGVRNAAARHARSRTERADRRRHRQHDLSHADGAVRQLLAE